MRIRKCIALAIVMVLILSLIPPGQVYASSRSKWENIPVDEDIEVSRGRHDPIDNRRSIKYSGVYEVRLDGEDTWGIGVKNLYYFNNAQHIAEIKSTMIYPWIHFIFSKEKCVF